jgi:hypothetical protein
MYFLYEVLINLVISEYLCISSHPQSAALGGCGYAPYAHRPIAQAAAARPVDCMRVINLRSYSFFRFLLVSRLAPVAESRGACCGCVAYAEDGRPARDFLPPQPVAMPSIRRPHERAGEDGVHSDGC